MGVSVTGVYAQVDISARSEVVESLTVTGTNDLVFPTILAGANTDETVAPNGGVSDGNNSGAGRFTITGGAQGANVDLDFNLPSNLTGNNDSGSLPISFGSQSAIHSTSDDASSGESFDPNSVEGEVTLGANGLYIFLGGTVSPDGVPADVYSGTITLTVDFSNI